MGIINYFTKDWRHMAAAGFVCLVGFSAIGLHLRGNERGLSPALRTATAPTLNERFNEVAAQLDAKVGTPPTKVKTLRKVGGATFFLAVEREASNPLDYEEIALEVCRERSPYGVDTCIVAIWDDENAMGIALPMTVQQEAAQVYAWSLGRSLWSCKRFPEMGSDRCF